ncbi:MAG: hypothetical protein HQ523_16850 [Lentisphaerae bacterium]|nr:hypothetical protein [Lentisphaerota bacterium]
MKIMTSPKGLCAELAEAYGQAAEKSVLAALNPGIFFGYSSVTADGIGHGKNTTFPGLDWGQSADALLWLGRTAEVLASWEHVTGMQREDGLLPFAIIPRLAGKTSTMAEHCTLTADARGAIFRHWVPGNPLRTLANVTVLELAEAIYWHTGERKWLVQQAAMLARTADWLIGQVNEEGLVHGAGYYVERPTRVEFDGVNQCCSARALQIAAELLDIAKYPAEAQRCAATADRIVACFRERFWAGDHCVEYIHPERGAVSHHGLTDVDWAAVATGVLRPEQESILWPILRRDPGFLYGGMPTGIATRPETYEAWEFSHNDRMDLAAMGRVWYLECQARARMGDRKGLMDSLYRVCKVGRENGYNWRERYNAQGGFGVEWYCEYPANLIRVVHRFVLESGSTGIGEESS